MGTRVGYAVVVVSLVASACTGPVVVHVEGGRFDALVPSAEQFTLDTARGIPGGFAALREGGVDRVTMVYEDDTVVFRLDGGTVATRRVTDRVEVRDSEGSGPFKGAKQVLALGGDALVLGGLTIREPVIWPGSFAGSPAITVKSHDREERGPAVSCDATESCLVLSSGVDPDGRYEDANDPARDENPVAFIEVSGEFVEYTLDNGKRVRAGRGRASGARACGLSETALWDVPAEVAPAMTDPVLAVTACPTTPGDTLLVIIERAEIPVLAPLDPGHAGQWCSPGPTCWRFAPI